MVGEVDWLILRLMSKKYAMIDGRTTLVVVQSNRGDQKAGWKVLNRSGILWVQAEVFRASMAGKVNFLQGMMALITLDSSRIRTRIWMVEVLLSNERRLCVRSVMPDWSHASDTDLRTLVVCLSIASVTTAGEGGREGNLMAGREGV